MSINHQRINQLTASELEIGAPVFSNDGRRLGEIEVVSGYSFKVNAPMQRDYWLAVSYVTGAAADGVTMSFGANDLGAYRLPGPIVEPEGEVPENEILLSAEEQREQREKMARELAEQRRHLPHEHPEGDDAAPDTGRTIGEPVEQEIERLERDGDDALDTELRERGIVEEERPAARAFGVKHETGSVYDSDMAEPDDVEIVETITVGELVDVPPSEAGETSGAQAALGRVGASGEWRGDDAMSRARGQAYEAASAIEQTTGRGAWRAIAIGQGAFFLAGGLWPVVHRRSFEAITGPKADFWLVKTVGLLLGGVGATLVAAGARKHARGVEAGMLGVSTAAALAAIDLTYVPKKRISKVYLLDAAAQFAIIGAWAAAPLLGRMRRQGEAPLDGGDVTGWTDTSFGGSPAPPPYTSERMDADRRREGPETTSAHPAPPTR